MFFHENLKFKIYSHNNSVHYGSDVYEYNGLDEYENCAVAVDFSTSDGRLRHVHVRVRNSKYDYLKSEIQIEYFRQFFSVEMAEEDIENASECGRTVYFD
jgi:hypothetical protein